MQILRQTATSTADAAGTANAKHVVHRQRLNPQSTGWSLSVAYMASQLFDGSFLTRASP